MQASMFCIVATWQICMFLIIVTLHAQDAHWPLTAYSVVLATSNQAYLADRDAMWEPKKSMCTVIHCRTALPDLTLQGAVNRIHLHVLGPRFGLCH